MSRGTLRLVPEPEMLRVLHMVVGVAARRQGIEEALVDDVRLGTAEAVTEAFAVHRGIPTDEPVTVEFDMAPPDVWIRVRHVSPGSSAANEPGEMGERMAVVAGIADDLHIGCDDVQRITISMRWRQHDTRV